DGVLDLTTVDVHASDLLHVLVGDGDTVGGEKILDDLLTRLDTELTVAEGERDTRVERFVHVGAAVRREDENTVVVFEEAEEGTDHRVAVDITTLASLQEHV